MTLKDSGGALTQDPSVPDPHPLSMQLGEHYAQTLAIHGPTPQGIEWGTEEKADSRYRAMASLFQNVFQGPFPSPEKAHLLDVGCGYGAFIPYFKKAYPQGNYTGIDCAPSMIQQAQEIYPSFTFLQGDVLTDPRLETYDYVVCNGVLTQRLTIPVHTMEAYAHQVIQRLFSLCRVGCAFNLTTDQVSYTKDNLFHINPGKILMLGLSMTPHVVLHHGYGGLFEMTLCLYR
jgi:SAM-dependent methyltransferase